MKIIEPKIVIQPYNGLEIMKNIERAMRVCFSDDTEILTNIGWKNIADVKDDLILTYNKELNKLEYEKSNLMMKNFDGYLKECNHLNVKFKITPDHRLFYANNSNLNYKLDSLENIKINKFYVPKWFDDCIGLNNLDYTEEISHMIEVRQNGSSAKIPKVTTFKICDDILILIGAYISERAYK